MNQKIDQSQISEEFQKKLDEFKQMKDRSKWEDFEDGDANAKAADPGGDGHNGHDANAKAADPANTTDENNKIT